MSECIYCGGEIGITCFDPQSHQEKAYQMSEREQLSTIEKLRRCQIGNIMRFSRDEMRIVKAIDRGNQLRSRPIPHGDGVDGIEWECWFEFEFVHPEDLSQITGRIPNKCVDLGLGESQTVYPKS
jgi:hypothetical protein